MILVTGVNGQLGYDVMKVLTARNIPCQGIDIQDLDITDESAVLAYLTTSKPSSVIHCAAYTAVDKAEDDLETCTAVNAKGPQYIAQACKAVGAKMMYISTDYVFSGAGEVPFEVHDTPAPTSAYGRTKLEGERAVQAILEEYYIVRISWVFGLNGNNFVKTMLKLAESRTELNVVCDQIGSPTYTADLAVLLCDMIESHAYGIYHATNEGFCSWAEFAEEIFALAGKDMTVHAIPSSEYPTRAVRPLNSRMSKDSLVRGGFAKLSGWQTALKRYLKEIDGDLT